MRGGYSRREILARTALAAAASSSALAAPGSAAAETPGAAPAAMPPAGSRERPARVVGTRRLAERLVELTVDSPALGSTHPVVLLTPLGWDERGPRDRWPVLYALAGGDGDPTTWTTRFQVQAIAELRDTLVVMPAMPLFGFCTDWWNHGVGGAPKVETYHLREVRPLMERYYGAGTRWVVAGESQGGFGALSYAARHPGLFRAAASYSAPVHPLQHPDVWLAGARYLGVDGTAIWGDPVRQRHLWEAHDPYYSVWRLRDAPVYVSSGDGTPGPLDGPDPEPSIPGLEKWREILPDDVVSVVEAICGLEARALADRLVSHGVRVTAHIHPGTHTGDYGYRELRASLPLLLGALRSASDG